MQHQRIRTLLLLPALAVAASAAVVPVDAGAAGARAAGGACPGQELMPSAQNIAKVRSATLCLLNRERAERGLKALAMESNLQSAAQSFSAQMVDKSFFDHTGPDGSTLTTRVRKTRYLAGGGGYALGENLAWGSGTLATPAKIVDSWMHSAGHKANILTARFRHIGIGVASGAPQSVSGQAATYTTDFGARG